MISSPYKKMETKNSWIWKGSMAVCFRGTQSTCIEWAKKLVELEGCYYVTPNELRHPKHGQILRLQTEE